MEYNRFISTQTGTHIKYRVGDKLYTVTSRRKQPIEWEMCGFWVSEDENGQIVEIHAVRYEQGKFIESRAFNERYEGVLFFIEKEDAISKIKIDKAERELLSMKREDGINDKEAKV